LFRAGTAGRGKRLDWIPLPLTGGEVLNYYCFDRRGKGFSKGDFLSLTRKHGICNRSHVDKVWALMSILEVNICCWENFLEVFPEENNFVDSFYQALGDTEVVLSESYVGFFTKIEGLVWQDLHVCRSEKEKVVMSKAYEAIKEAVLKNNYFMGSVVGVILSYYGESVIRLPYSLNARDRFLLRKEGIEKSQVHFEKVIVNEIVERAKNEIYERLLMATLVECKTNLAHNTEISVKYIIHPDLVRDALSRHFGYPNVRTPNRYDKRRSRSGRQLIASDTVVDTLMKYFKDDGFKVSEIRTRSRKGYEKSRSRSPRRRSDGDESREHVDGLKISWNSVEVVPAKDSLNRNPNLL